MGKKNFIRIRSNVVTWRGLFVLFQILLTSLVCFCQPKNKELRNRDKEADIEYLFSHPPESAKPGVLWMWMGSAISKKGITKDLEALKAAGFNRATMFTPADALVPWAAQINSSPTPQIVAWMEPWWEMVRFAAIEAKRLGIDFGMHNCAGYSSSGGTWITPERSMQGLCWSQQKVTPENAEIILAKPTLDSISHVPYQDIINPQTGAVEKPVVPARQTFYRDIVLLAMPAKDVVLPSEVINLTNNLRSDGKLNWKPSSGQWTIYRFGHTTTGTQISPAQTEARGLECDKMNAEAVSFHMDQIIKAVKGHLGNLIGNGFSHLHFDSYEAGVPTWTPKMEEEFLARRGYDLLPFLPVLTGAALGSKEDALKFKNDFDATIKDLYRDVYFKIVSDKLNAAGLDFKCEPYGGPWRYDDVLSKVGTPMTEFWTNDGKYSPGELDASAPSIRSSAPKIVEAEAFSGMPKESQWNETPAWLKPIGDAAFCAGVNRLMLHRFVHQPWDDAYLPGASFGQWGTHFDRTQTWWKPFKATVQYWQRCQALLQWGQLVTIDQPIFKNSTDSAASIKFIHRRYANTDIYFIANTARFKTNILCTFPISGRQPELWDPVTGERKFLHQYSQKNNRTSFDLPFDEAQSFFVVFKKTLSKSPEGDVQDFPSRAQVEEITGTWQVQFDTARGGPSKPVLFNRLTDWTQNSGEQIKYFSGTAIYRNVFYSRSGNAASYNKFLLRLGEVKHICQVYLNGRDLGVVWTAPWEVKIPKSLLKKGKNELRIDVTNVWANRLIGDEQQPDDCEWLPGHMGDVIPGYPSGRFLKAYPQWFLNKWPRASAGRFCFTTWDYFTKDSPLIPSGLLGPVTIETEMKFNRKSNK